MKTMNFMSVATIFLLPLAVAAQQNNTTTGAYVSISGGISTLNDSGITEEDRVNGIPVQMSLDFETKPGIAFLGGLGYRFGSNFRLEAEVAYQQDDIDKIDINVTASNGNAHINLGGGVSAEGEIAGTSGFLTGHYDFTGSSALTPFISAGIGMTRVELNVAELHDVNGNNALTEDIEVDGVSLAYHVGGGFNYALSGNLSLDLKYRYLSSVNLELEDSSGHAEEFDYSSHNVYCGLRMSF